MSLSPRSEVVADSVGWVWLQPHEPSLRRCQGWAAVYVAILAVALFGALDYLPGVASVAVAAVAGGAALWLLRRIYYVANARVAASSIGVLVHTGLNVFELGWDAVDSVTAAASDRGRVRGAGEDGGQTGGGRAAVVVAVGREAHATPARFDEPDVRQWLEQCAEAAREAGETVAAAEAGLGFRARAG